MQCKLSLKDKVEQGLLLAYKRMLHEKALHNRDVVIGDGKGGVRYVSAKEIIATHPEYQ